MSYDQRHVCLGAYKIKPRQHGYHNSVYRYSFTARTYGLLIKSFTIRRPRKPVPWAHLHSPSTCLLPFPIKCIILYYPFSRTAILFARTLVYLTRAQGFWLNKTGQRELEVDSAVCTTLPLECRHSHYRRDFSQWPQYRIALRRSKLQHPRVISTQVLTF